MAFGFVIALVGASLVFVGQRMFWIRQLSRLRGCVIEGEIVKWKRIRVRGMDTAGEQQKHHPIVSFVDPSGVERTTQLGYQYTTLYRDEHPVGSKHSVLFDPKYPDRSLDTTWTTAYFLPALLSLCGGLVLLIGLGVLLGS